jgi:hypothetical protein
MRTLLHIVLKLLTDTGSGILGGIAISLVYYILLVVSGFIVPFWHAIIYGAYLGSIAGFLLSGLTTLLHGNRDKVSPLRTAIILLIMSPLYLFVFGAMSPDLIYLVMLFTLSMFASYHFIRLSLKNVMQNWLQEQLT